MLPPKSFAMNEIPQDRAPELHSPNAYSYAIPLPADHAVA
ncbi:hypothetical protein MA3A0930S_0103 [Mycobacteroides abscessus 3A-0930-S]|nr:hypothetical protein MA4S0726RB_4594 [Mycobacteroides abscessus 4S-0726-RB]EIU40607.1 hypothetical protein MA6G0125R_4374 [Mycobacteroides abscessus 6G-0125-R]EIV41665.1 hypothetical protein MA3A0122R_0241 [Mycobacteroides abscessus 3A-0122-R]EIV58395.1 hypothetical protein MA3A0930S_0103 [Mycobacteroides abscessus 3A-0930-S]EIV62017.1 hypothetical protein MA3A0930R_0104 [Mycobacteroides abscessus 3A-0930-R]EIV84491.1 hypothetical protein MM3A0810R_0103 [Mycobacteroides abscessus 3A-0810-R]